MPNTNWKPIDKAERGMGDVLLRVGAGSLDPAFVGHESDGRWFDQEGREVAPRWFCPIPSFDGAAE
ncbi:hypothetical protein [Bradyrhizobium diazoefficiens]|uniref:hypothetical protein n=1 Tax=Bradyrhizobium diazoefficiens TaxID=1355477 RepID=UPI001B5C4546|nr:hypothetical protein [Bradyrhizobium japonicum]